MDVKIMTYNIMHGLYYPLLKNESKRVVDLNNLAKVIKEEDPDIVGLNEVYNDIENIKTGKEVEILANLLGYKYYNFGKAIIINNGIEYGNAILSKYEINNFKVHHILDPLIHDEDVFYEHRVILEMDIIINNNPLKVFVTHFGLAYQEQINAFNLLNALIKKNKDKKIIFMGDLNLTCDNLIYQKLSNILNDSVNVINGNSFTFNSLNPSKKIDYIFTKNIIQKDSHVLNRIQSDHFPYILRIMM